LRYENRIRQKKGVTLVISHEWGVGGCGDSKDRREEVDLIPENQKKEGGEHMAWGGLDIGRTKKKTPEPKEKPKT